MMEVKIDHAIKFLEDLHREFSQSLEQKREALSKFDSNFDSLPFWKKFIKDGFTHKINRYHLAEALKCAKDMEEAAYVALCKALYAKTYMGDTKFTINSDYIVREFVAWHNSTRLKELEDVPNEL